MLEQCPRESNISRKNEKRLYLLLIVWCSAFYNEWTSHLSRNLYEMKEEWKESSRIWRNIFIIPFQSAPLKLKNKKKGRNFVPFYYSIASSCSTSQLFAVGNTQWSNTLPTASKHRQKRRSVKKGKTKFQLHRQFSLFRALYILQVLKSRFWELRKRNKLGRFLLFDRFLRQFYTPQPFVIKKRKRKKNGRSMKTLFKLQQGGKGREEQRKIAFAAKRRNFSFLSVLLDAVERLELNKDRE